MVEARRPKTPPDRLKIILIIQYVIVGIIIARLFWLQVVKGNYYQAVAAKEHYGYTELPARRGEILIRDNNSTDLYRVATNTTLDLVYADPTLVKNPDEIVGNLAPLLFNLQEARDNDATRIEEERKRIEPVLTELELQQKIQDAADAAVKAAADAAALAAKNAENPDAKPATPLPTPAPFDPNAPSTPEQQAKAMALLNSQQLQALKPLTDEELKTKFRQDMYDKVTAKNRTQIILGTDIDEATIAKVKERNMAGIHANNKTVTIYPLEITDRTTTYSTLATLLDVPVDQILKLVNGKNRYVVLKRKIPPGASEKIKEFLKNDKRDGKFAGIGLQAEFYRYYPEKTLAANIIGYVDSLGMGISGIENKFNVQLEGKKGVFQTEKDSVGRQITVGDSVIQPAVDGDNIVLTIDRSIQMKLDKLIQKGVTDTRADDGIGIVYEPQTGKVLAMSHYPSFDPNSYGKVFEKTPINLKADEVKRLVPIDEKTGHYTLVTDNTTGEKIDIFKEIYRDETIRYTTFKNKIGALAFQNKAVSWPYETGSVFKPLVMAAAIDDKDITPTTIYNDIGPIKTDEFTIKNALLKYYGEITMTQVLEKSLNTGMAYIARKMGKNLLYDYIMRFGFAQKTDIEFSDESAGKLEHFSKWAESELITHAFGQGFTATPLQMVMAYGAIANKGAMMQPYIIDEIQQANGKIIKNDPRVVRQVISAETANAVTSMMVSAVEQGVAQHAGVPNHYIAGKTGTAQTYYRGVPLFGVGTTNATVMGFAPIDKPRFVILVKLSKPRTTVWADATSAPVFSQMAQFLFDYYNIPPDKKVQEKKISDVGAA